MALLYGSLLAGYGQLPIAKPEAGKGVNSSVRIFREVITLASQANTDTILLAKVPAGYLFLFGILITDTSLGSSTLAIGITGSTGKYRAAATFTATNTPTLFGVGAAANSLNPLSADETIFATTAVAALPSSGTLGVQMYFAKP